MPTAARRRAGIPNIIARTATPRFFSLGERACSTAVVQDRSPNEIRAATRQPQPTLMAGFLRNKVAARTQKILSFITLDKPEPRQQIEIPIEDPLTSIRRPSWMLG